MAKFKSVFTAAIALSIAGSLTGIVHAQDDLVVKRRAAMSEAGKANGGIGVVARAGTATPEQMAIVKDTAGKLVAAFDVVKDPANWPKGSAQGEASGSFAKPEVWSDAATFKDLMDKAVANAAAVKAAADAGDLAQLKTAQAAMQASCGACHSKFRGS